MTNPLINRSDNFEAHFDEELEGSASAVPLITGFSSQGAIDFDITISEFHQNKLKYMIGVYEGCVLKYLQTTFVITTTCNFFSISDNF